MSAKRKPFDLFVDFNDGQYAQPGPGYPPWQTYQGFGAPQPPRGVGPDFKARVISCKVIREEAQCSIKSQ
jgi:hypothetical protein